MCSIESTSTSPTSTPRAVRGGSRVVQTFAVDEHEHARRVEAAQPRANLEGAGPDDRDAGCGGQRVAGADRRHLMDGPRADGVRAERERRLVAFTAGGRHRDLLLHRTELQLEVECHGLVVVGDDHGPRGVREADEAGGDAVDARTQVREREPPRGIRRRSDFLAGGDIQDSDDGTLESTAGAIGHAALNFSSQCRSRQRKGQREGKENRAHENLLLYQPARRRLAQSDKTPTNRT